MYHFGMSIFWKNTQFPLILRGLCQIISPLLVAVVDSLKSVLELNAPGANAPGGRIWTMVGAITTSCITQYGDVTGVVWCRRNARGGQERYLVRYSATPLLADSLNRSGVAKAVSIGKKVAE